MWRSALLMVGSGLCAVALVTFCVRAELHHKPYPPVPQLLGDNTMPDDLLLHPRDALSETLTRCSALGAAAETDADCHQAWAESRAHFLGEKAAQSDRSVVPNLGPPLDGASDPKTLNTGAPELSSALPSEPMAAPVLPKSLSTAAQGQ